jgi:protein-L-isoaspartate(D-aspartate) O-methyltransferase
MDNVRVFKDMCYEQRLKMIKEQIEARGIFDTSVLKAIFNVPRHLFIPEDLRHKAYDDCPLPIGNSQTISQPYIVAFMTEALEIKGNEKILEIGTGSGYQAAILSKMVKEVYTIEIVKELYEKTKILFEELGYENIKCKSGDGYNGWHQEAPFDGIIITAAPHKIPEILLAQLKINGKMIVPVGEGWSQELKCIIKTEEGIIIKNLLGVRFVPMTGEIERH